MPYLAVLRMVSTVSTAMRPLVGMDRVSVERLILVPLVFSPETKPSMSVSGRGTSATISGKELVGLLGAHIGGAELRRSHPNQPADNNRFVLPEMPRQLAKRIPLNSVEPHVKLMRPAAGSRLAVRGAILWYLRPTNIVFRRKSQESFFPRLRSAVLEMMSLVEAQIAGVDQASGNTLTLILRTSERQQKPEQISAHFLAVRSLTISS